MKKFSTLIVLLFFVAFNGNSQVVQWAGQLAGQTSGSKFSTPQLHLDSSGNIISAGSVSGTVDMDPGPASSITSYSNLSSNVYVQKLDPAGNLLWRKSCAVLSEMNINDIATDATGNVYVGGYFNSSFDADPGSGVFMLNVINSYSNIFIIKLDASGNFLWAVSEPCITTGPPPSIQLFSFLKMAVDKSGNLWTASNINISKKSLVKKYSSGGVLLKSAEIAADINSGVDARIDIDPAGSLILTGTFVGTVDFDPGTATRTLTTNSTSGTSSFIAKLDSNINLQWVKQIETTGGSSNYITNHAAFDAAGNIHVAGIFHGSADFDPGPGISIKSFLPGATSMFVLKLDVNGNFVWVHTFDSQNSANTMNDIVTDAAGNVCVVGSFAGMMDFNYGFTPAHILFPSGTRQAFLAKLNSTGSLSWVKHMSTMGSYGAECFSIVRNGSDELIAAGIFADVLDTDPENPASIKLNANANCRDVFITRLYNCPAIDTTVVKSNDTLRANATGVIYQWMNCNTGAVMVGATAQTFVPAVSGSYRVIITNGSCTDSSKCYDVISLDVQKLETEEAINIYPNPTNGVVNIELGKRREWVRIEVSTALGQLIQACTYKNAQAISQTIEGATGMYFIKVTTDDNYQVISHVLKQ